MKNRQWKIILHLLVPSIIWNKHRNKDYCYFTKILWLGMGNEDDYKITT